MTTTRDEQLIADGLRGLVEYGILEVVTPDDDPLKATYRIIDPEAVERALAELGYDMT